MSGLFDALFRGITSGEAKLPPSQLLKGEVLNIPDLSRSHRDDSSLGDEDEAREEGDSLSTLDPLEEIPAIMLPIRPRKMDLSFDRSVDGNTTGSTPGFDLTFGPQSLPFALRRRVVTDTPSKGRSIGTTRIQSAPIKIVHPHGDEEEAEQVERVVSPDLSAQGPVVPLSSWRQEQLKFMRRAKLGNTRERPIPSLHGPHSLPYARNPSGVDATIPDESAYVSHVYGLKAASHVKAHGNGTPSVTPDGRLTAMPPRNTASRPLVLREPHQNLGLYKGSNEVHHPARDPVSRGSSRRLAVPEPISLPATGPEAVSASAMLRSQLHGGTNILSPIPGSPSVDQPDSFQQLYNLAVANTTRHRSNSSVLAHPPQSHIRHSSLPARATHRDLDSLLDLCVAGGAIAQSKVLPGRRVVSDEPQASFASAIHSTPAKPPTPCSVSKADASENWRTKRDVMQTPGGHDIPDISVPSSAGEDPVMTIDSLFSKFNLEPKNAQASSVTKAPPNTPQIGSKSAQRAPPKGSVQRVRSPLSESTGVQVNSAKPTNSNLAVVPKSAKKTATAPSRGTPGAGKHLKKKAAVKKAQEKKQVEA